MKILILGNGGREHALLWKLRKDAPAVEFFATRPNGGMAPHCQSIEIAPDDVEAIAGWAVANSIDLVVVGPEAPLARGVIDRLEKAGVPSFGPSAAAARIESSKAYAKDLMRNAGIPTADYRIFTDLDGAIDYIREAERPLVVKASGLAAGKGAVVCDSTDEAVQAARGMLEDLSFGEAGREIVVEEFMQGEELSLFALCDGEHALPLLPSQDHKRIGEGDTGLNTGGMGAYAPVSISSDELIERVCSDILLPTLRAMAMEGAPFRGLLYAGLMLTHDGPKVVEFNCRFGDPETQAVLPMMDSSLLDLLAIVAGGGSLAGRSVRWRAGAAATTVLASRGYPESYEKGKEIEIPDELNQRDDILVFHAGTRLTEGRLETSGGRVIAVTGLGENLQDAVAKSLDGADRIRFEGRYFRRDIGWRELDRLTAD